MKILHHLRCRCLSLGAGMLALMPLKASTPGEMQSAEKVQAAHCPQPSVGDLNIWSSL
ncbi:hypothetical protein [Brevifollis gellanilyticus]|uniref:hypothetical protein n=1 Tax=Brevifollis gellanilyticus TaxID=748831 RepID=UPI0014787C71|nr:hypothetical protein [Brevifollis gellanilyticus]